MGFFGAANGLGDSKKALLPKICHTNLAMIKRGTVIPYLERRFKKYMNHVTHPLSSADISIFSPEINKFCYFKK